MDQEERKQHVDVTMGSYDGAETCELLGAYMLSFITAKFKTEVGLYHDDGLAICKATPKEIEKTKKEVCQVFKSNDLIQPPTRESSEKQKKTNKKHHMVQPSFQLKRHN